MLFGRETFGIERLLVDRVVLVEGKYDKQRLETVIEGLIVSTGGFRIYKDREKAAMIRAVARKRGAVIVTDSDRAGFQIRGFLRSLVSGADVIHLYIPQIAGREKRKHIPGAEGLLGVEGMSPELLRELFIQGGAAASPLKEGETGKRRITRMDFYQDGLMGGPDASKKRLALLGRLGLPGYLTTNGLLEVINSLISYEEYCGFVGRPDFFKPQA